MKNSVQTLCIQCFSLFKEKFKKLKTYISAETGSIGERFGR